MHVVILCGTVFLLSFLSYTSCTSVQEQIIKDLPLALKLKMLNITEKTTANHKSNVNYDNPRVDDVIRMRVYGEDPTPVKDDKTIKIKLFRLMYETIQNNEIKFKRADEIENYYEKDRTFEIGRLIGDVSTKHSVIVDTAAALKRKYREWKPIDHINAYEQISSQAVEINNLIETIKNLAENKGK